MSNLGPQWEDDEDYSPARMDAKGILRDTGTNIQAIATTRQLGLVCPTDTSGGLIKNVTYITDYDSSFNRVGFIPIFHTHTHDSDNEDDEGGSYLNIRIANIGAFGEFNYVAIDKDPASFWQTSATGGTLSFQDGGITDKSHQITTGITTGNFITASANGLIFEWGDRIETMFRTFLNVGSNILARTGLGIDSIDASPSTSRRQLALEGCDGHGTNWVMLNANGNSASLEVTATTAPLAPGSAQTYQLSHIPATTDTFYYNGVQNAQSSTNVADDGNTDIGRLFRWGVKLPTGIVAVTQKLYWVKVLGNQKAN